MTASRPAQAVWSAVRGARSSLWARSRERRGVDVSRHQSTGGPSFTPVDLSFDVVQPQSVQAAGQSLVICHGLFGSKQNWRSLAKSFAQRLGMPVYTLDMRNHGSSPHAEPHSYPAMAADISQFFRKQGLESGVNLLGHSMGGKAVMALALNEELNSPLRSMISVDMSPAKGRISPEFAAYCESMLEIEKAKVGSKHEADKILQKVEPILATRQFLLTNALLAHRTPPPSHSHTSTTTTTSDPPHHPYIKFRIPLTLLHDAIPHIGDFPYTPPPPVSPTSPQWTGPALFLKGEHSKYLNKRNIPVAEAFFPNMRLEVLDTGHWVHAERPKETMDLVEGFINGIKD